MRRNLSDGWQQRWVWPVIGRISGVYGSQRILGGVPRDPHHGVDIAVPAGTPIVAPADGVVVRSEEHTSELQSLMRISYAVFCLKKKIESSHSSPRQGYVISHY